MRIEKKRIIKEDGRSLTFYHFPDTASNTQKAAFDATTPAVSAPEPATTKATKPGREGDTNV